MKKYREIILIAILLTGTCVTLGFYLSSSPERPPAPKRIASVAGNPDAGVDSNPDDPSTSGSMQPSRYPYLGSTEIFMPLIPKPTPPPTPPPPPKPMAKLDAVIKGWKLVGFNGTQSVTIQNGNDYFDFNLAEIKEIELGNVTLPVRLDEIDDNALKVKFRSPKDEEDQDWQQELELRY